MRTWCSVRKKYRKKNTNITKAPTLPFLPLFRDPSSCLLHRRSFSHLRSCSPFESFSFSARFAISFTDHLYCNLEKIDRIQIPDANIIVSTGRFLEVVGRIWHELQAPTCSYVLKGYTTHPYHVSFRNVVGYSCTRHLCWSVSSWSSNSRNACFFELGYQLIHGFHLE